MLGLWWNSCESVSRYPPQKSLFSQERLKNCKFTRQILKRVTYLHEARPPIDKAIPEDSPIVFERAIKKKKKNQTAGCRGGRGDMGGRRRGWFSGKAAQLCAGARKRRALPPPPSCRGTALHCRYGAWQQGWGLLPAHLSANSGISGAEHKINSPPSSWCLPASVFPLNEIRKSVIFLNQPVLFAYSIFHWIQSSDEDKDHG